MNNNTLSFDAIKEVCLDGPGHYLGHDKTLAVMESEYVYPEISDRSSPKEWKENNNPEILQTADLEVKNILENKKSNNEVMSRLFSSISGHCKAIGQSNEAAKDAR